MSKTFDHLLPVFRPYAWWSAEKRVGWIRQDRWINCTRAEQILGRVENYVGFTALTTRGSWS
jgi:hypothetical protein